MTRNVSIFLIFTHFFMLFGPALSNPSLIKMKILLVRGKKIAADKGSDDGIEDGMLFLVHRGGNIIGMAKVVRLKEKRCALIAETLSDNIKIQAGDMLLLDLKELRDSEAVAEPEQHPESESETNENLKPEISAEGSEADSTIQHELPPGNYAQTEEVPENSETNFSPDALEKPDTKQDEAESPEEFMHYIEDSTNQELEDPFQPLETVEKTENFTPYVESDKQQENVHLSEVEKTPASNPIVPEFGATDDTESEIGILGEQDLPNETESPDTIATQTRPVSGQREIRLDYFFEGQISAETDYSGGGAVGIGLATGCVSGLIGWGIGYIVLSGMDAPVPLHRVQSMKPSFRMEFSNGYREKIIKKRKTKFTVGAALGTVAGLLLVLSMRN